jgi:splicing factor 3A subunit 1
MTDLIIPPPSVIKIIEATVAVVVQWGEAMERRILEERKDTNLMFLSPDDPFHAYYQLKLEEARSQTRHKQSVPPAPLAPAATAGSRPIPKVLPPSFTYRQPPDIGGLQLDVIHLTAQNAALYGKEFLAAIARQEADSPLFNFLKPEQPYFRFFFSLYDQYKLALDPSHQLRRRLEQESSSLSNVKANLDLETQHERMVQEQKRKEAEDARAGGGLEMYDWDEFTVLKTIEYQEEPVASDISAGQRVPKTLRPGQKLEQISPITGQKVDVEEFGEDRKSVV